MQDSKAVGTAQLRYSGEDDTGAGQVVAGTMGTRVQGQEGTWSVS